MADAYTQHFVESVDGLCSRIKAKRQTGGAVSLAGAEVDAVLAALKAATVAANGDSPTIYTLALRRVGEKKIQVIKAVREITSLGLKEAKELVDTVPSDVGRFFSHADALAAAGQLREQGASVDVVGQDAP